LASEIQIQEINGPPPRFPSILNEISLCKLHWGRNIVYNLTYYWNLAQFLLQNPTSPNVYITQHVQLLASAKHSHIVPHHHNVCCSSGWKNTKCCKKVYALSLLMYFWACIDCLSVLNCISNCIPALDKVFDTTNWADADASWNAVLTLLAAQCKAQKVTFYQLQPHYTA